MFAHLPHVADPSFLHRIDKKIQVLTFFHHPTSCPSATRRSFVCEINSQSQVYTCNSSIEHRFQDITLWIMQCIKKHFFFRACFCERCDLLQDVMMYGMCICADIKGHSLGSVIYYNLQVADQGIHSRMNRNRRHLGT